MEQPSVAPHRKPVVTSTICPVERYTSCWSWLRDERATAPRAKWTSSGQVQNMSSTCIHTMLAVMEIFMNMQRLYYSYSMQDRKYKCNLSSPAPCVPQNLEASLSCSDNVASMSWNNSQGLGQLYRVTAVSTDGHEDECMSSVNRCDLTGLQCGKYYTATVKAEYKDCESKPSDSVTIKTGMFTPKCCFFLFPVLSSAQRSDLNHFFTSYLSHLTSALHSRKHLH